MNHPPPPLSFDDPDLFARVDAATDEALDTMPFGVIGFDSQGHVRRYNRYEARAARFEQEDVIGQHVFIELAPCMNNYLVAGRFEEVHLGADALDTVLPYVLTFRMRPTKVRLRLLDSATGSMRYILVDRQPSASATTTGNTGS